MMRFGVDAVERMSTVEWADRTSFSSASRDWTAKGARVSSSLARGGGVGEATAFGVDVGVVQTVLRPAACWQGRSIDGSGEECVALGRW